MADTKTNRALRTAIGHHQAGRLSEAEALYRQVLREQPNHADALNLLGVLSGEQGHLDAAADLIGRAVAANPTVAEYHANLGETYRRIGRLEPAEASLRKALELNPAHVDAQNNLGLVLQSRGLADQAIAAFSEAVKIRPDFVLAHSNLGLALSEKREFAKAISALRKSLELNPNQADVHANLGACLTWTNELTEAIEACRKAISINPRLAEAHNNLGACLRMRGQYAEAAEEGYKAIELRPDYSAAYSNLGDTLLYQGQMEKANTMHRRAVELEPEREEAHKQLGTFYFFQGDLPRGFAEYEWRLKEKEVIISSIPRPRWDGRDLNGKTILIHAEQGFGDLIQTVRYVPLVSARHGKIIIGCHGELVRLFADVPCVEACIEVGEVAPPFDVYCPFMSLPLALGTTLLSIPAYVPYLHAKPEPVRSWSQRLGPRDGKMRVGLVWAGRAEHDNDRNRSIRLNQLACLKDIPGVSFYSLQKGPAAAQIADSVFAGRLNDWTNDLNDFVDTAALLANLDLLIAVDTAVAHLAGALGKAVWILLPTPPDWRWMLHRSDSPWYPTARLFRQKRAGEWGEPIAELCQALSMAGQQRAPAV